MPNYTEDKRIQDLNLGTASDTTEFVVANGDEAQRIPRSSLGLATIASLAVVATSGDYNDLLNLPTLFSGSYNDLTDVPTSFTPSAHTHVLAEITDAGTLAGLNDLSTFDTDDLSEGVTNLYFTNARAVTALTGANISIFNNDANYLASGDNISELVNDANYLASGDDISELNNDENFIAQSDVIRVVSAELKDPQVSDEFRVQVPANATVTRIVGATNGANTVTFNVEERLETTPNTAGTDVMASDLVADSDTQVETSFSNPNIDQYNWLTVSISAISGTPGYLSVTIIYNLN